VDQIRRADPRTTGFLTAPPSMPAHDAVFTALQPSGILVDLPTGLAM
jgi:hypothetical protein